MRRCWINPSPPGGALRKQDRVWVDSAIMPALSPAPPNNGTIVPAGWVLQIGSDGEMDTALGDIRSGVLVYDPVITSFVVPYYTGGWPPDPMAGQPGHTAQRGTGAG